MKAMADTVVGDTVVGATCQGELILWNNKEKEKYKMLAAHHSVISRI